MTANSFTFKLDEAQQAELRRILAQSKYRPEQVPHTQVASYNFV